MKLDAGRLGAQRGPFALGLLHAVFAEHALAGRNRRAYGIAIEGFGDRHQRHRFGPAAGLAGGLADPVANVVETVDREKIAAELAKEIARQGKAPKLYVQVNTGSEPQKAGIEPRGAVEFVRRCREIHRLAIEGLMCIPPLEENPGPHFALLAKLAKEAGLDKLSMGMSGDYELAIAFGATSVRVGSAIFGAR